MSASRALALGLIIVLLSGCAGTITRPPTPQQTAIEAEQLEQSVRALEHRLAETDRLHRISWKILSANVQICGDDVRQSYGIRVWNLDALPDIYQAAAQKRYGLDEHVMVQGLPPGSQAASLGLQPGDVILSLNGTDIQTGPRAPEKFRTALRHLDGKAALLGIQRSGEELSVEVTAATICAPGIIYMDQPGIDAHADGRDIFISRGLMAFADNDEELAMVIAHELAHNILGHTDHKLLNGIVGMIGGGAIDILLASGGIFTGGGFAMAGANFGNMSHSLDFEREADYMALYFMARAGYDTKKAANFWRHMAIEQSIFIERAQTHPNTAERYVSMLMTHDEIMEKRKNGMDILPDMVSLPNGPHQAPRQSIP